MEAVEAAEAGEALLGRQETEAEPTVGATLAGPMELRS